MPKKAGSFSYSKRGCRFTWEGGAYIDVHIDGVCVEVINVWKYDGSNEPAIGRDQVSFVAECEAWLKGVSAEELRNYTENARLMKAAGYGS